MDTATIEEKGGEHNNSDRTGTPTQTGLGTNQKTSKMLEDIKEVWGELIVTHGYNNKMTEGKQHEKLTI